MTREKQILALTCLLVVLPIVLTAECPSKEDIPSCICKDPTSISGLEIECGEIDSEGLARVASRLRGKKVSSFFIRASTLGSIPHDVFKGIKLRTLIIRSSTLSALTDGSEAFVGLEDQLEYLEINKCVFKNKWDWSVLRNLRKLNELAIWKSIHLETIGEDLMISSLSSVKSFAFGGNNISPASDLAFDSFKYIESLTIILNKLKIVKRTMLPNPALKLRDIDISCNEIEKFPEDMFTNMPNLRELYIDGNKILVLDEKTFSPVWEQLVTFYASGNPLRCDIRMSWILEKRSPSMLIGECESPPELNGKELETLQLEDLMYGWKLDL